MEGDEIQEPGRVLISSIDELVVELVFLETIGWRLTMHALVSIRDALVALQSETRGSTRRNVC